MSHFYGSVQGNRGEATRGGSKDSGLVTYCASWAGAVKCDAYVDKYGVDCVRISLVPWHGRGVTRELYDGPVGSVAEYSNGMLV